MKSAGKVVNFSNKGSLVLRSRNTPRIGDTIVDRRSNILGKVVRITGPVAEPYVIVSPKVRDTSLLNSLLGREVFISERVEKGGSDRRGSDLRKSRSNFKGGSFKGSRDKGKKNWKSNKERHFKGRKKMS